MVAVFIIAIIIIVFFINYSFIISSLFIKFQVITYYSCLALMNSCTSKSNQKYFLPLVRASLTGFTLSAYCFSLSIIKSFEFFYKGSAIYHFVTTSVYPLLLNWLLVVFPLNSVEFSCCFTKIGKNDQIRFYRLFAYSLSIIISLGLLCLCDSKYRVFFIIHKLFFIDKNSNNELNCLCIVILTSAFNFGSTAKFSIEHHLGLDLAIFYWHLVDVVWLLVFYYLYWWSIKLPFTIIYNYSVE